MILDTKPELLILSGLPGSGKSRRAHEWVAEDPAHLFTNAQGNMVVGESDLANALIKDPTGGVCAFCGGPNGFADDCGFWYLWPDGPQGPNGPSCEACFNGESGQKHQARYGVGER